jgi:anti-sigma factor RsiW
MSNGMTHDDAREALEALALDALEPSERDAVLAHVAGCAACRADLAAVQRTAAELAYVVPPVPMSPAQRDRIRGRLLARATRDGEVVPIDSAQPAAARRGPSGSAWLAMAASVIAIASTAALVQTRRERDGLREAVRVASAERGARAVAVDSLRATLQDRDRLIANMTGSQVAVMTLAASGPQSPSGRMFWDQQHDAWVFVGHHLKAPRAGRTYQLWLVTPTAKISAGTFTPGPDGHAMVRATFALG